MGDNRGRWDVIAHSSIADRVLTLYWFTCRSRVRSQCVILITVIFISSGERWNGNGSIWLHCIGTISLFLPMLVGKNMPWVKLNLYNIFHWFAWESCCLPASLQILNDTCKNVFFCFFYWILLVGQDEPCIVVIAYFKALAYALCGTNKGTLFKFHRVKLWVIKPSCRKENIHSSVQFAP